MGKSTAIRGLYDQPMWQGMEQDRLELMACKDCGAFRYPPGPICPDCMSMEAEWRPVAGKGTVISWVVFHRRYFDDFPPPYDAMAVRLDEGPIIVTNSTGPVPEGSWIGRRVALTFVDHDGRRQHAARFVD